MIPSIDNRQQKKMYKGKKLEESSIIHKSFSTSLLTESPNQTFERQIDNYTRLLEQDKRKFFRVQQNRNEVAKEFSKKARQLQSLKGKQFSNEVTKMKGKVKIFENQLDQTINSYNDVLSSNKSLKVQIDELRKKKLNQKEVMEKITGKISQYSQLIYQQEAETAQRRDAIEHDKQGILEVKAKNEEEAQMFRGDVSNARDSLGGSQAGNQVMKRRIQVEQKNESTDNLPFVRYRLRHLIVRNKERVKVIDNYKKTMDAIWRGFQDIKEESGINDIEQITSTFLKHEEQNHFIYEYIGKLSRQIEDLNEQIDTVRQKTDLQRQKNQEYQQELGVTPKKVQSKMEKQKHSDNCQQQVSHLDSFLALASTELKTLGTNDEITRFNLIEELARVESMIDQHFTLKDELGNTNIFFEDMTKYTKGPPNYAELVQQSREQKLMEGDKLRQFASDFWERRKGKAEIK